jgi:dihydroorotase
VTTKYLIKNVDVSGVISNIAIENELITAIGSNLQVEGASEFDFTGSVALPGLVDLHTHLREPGKEDAETVLSGSQAAARGGFTAISAMANTSPVADTAGVVEQVYRLGQSAGLVDVFPVGAVTQGIQGEHLAEIGAMADSAARVRVFSDDGNCVFDPLLMRRALEYIKRFDGVIAQHAQEPRLTQASQMNVGLPRNFDRPLVSQTGCRKDRAAYWSYRCQ